MFIKQYPLQMDMKDQVIGAFKEYIFPFCLSCTDQNIKFKTQKNINLKMDRWFADMDLSRVG